jgi:hypothetical protein
MKETNYTTIQIKKETWKELMKLRSLPSDTFDKIIEMLINEHNFPK